MKNNKKFHAPVSCSVIIMIALGLCNLNAMETASLDFNAGLRLTEKEIKQAVNLHVESLQKFIEKLKTLNFTEEVRFCDLDRQFCEIADISFEEEGKQESTLYQKLLTIEEMEDFKAESIKYAQDLIKSTVEKAHSRYPEFFNNPNL